MKLYFIRSTSYEIPKMVLATLTIHCIKVILSTKSHILRDIVGWSHFRSSLVLCIVPFCINYRPAVRRHGMDWALDFAYWNVTPVDWQELKQILKARDVFRLPRRFNTVTFYKITIGSRSRDWTGHEITPAGHFSHLIILWRTRLCAWDHSQIESSQISAVSE